MNIAANAYGKFKGQRIQDAGCIIDRIVGDGFKNVKTILDVGCADGIVTQEVSDLIPGANIYALDIDPAMIELADELNKNDDINFILQDVTAKWEDLDPKLKQLEDKVDLIFCNYVMNWIKPRDRSQAMKNISRLLAPAGKCYFTIWCYENFLPLLEPEESERFNGLLEVDGPEEQHNTWTEMITKEGLKCAYNSGSSTEWTFESEQEFLESGIMVTLLRPLLNEKLVNSADAEAEILEALREPFLRALARPVGSPLPDSLDGAKTWHYNYFVFTCVKCFI